MLWRRARFNAGFKVPRIRGVLQAPEEQPYQRYAPTIVAFTDCDKEDSYSELMQAQRKGSAIDLLEPYFTEADTLVAAANWADLHTYLPDDLMVKVDVASMAHGLESRSPLLDHALMEWAAEVPEEVRMARGVTKALFKSAMEPYLPAELLYRPKKGFSPPIDQWLRNDLKELAYDTLLSQSSTKRGLFRREVCPPLARRTFRPCSRSSPPALGALDARTMVSNVDRCANKRRNLPSRGMVIATG